MEVEKQTDAEFPEIISIEVDSNIISRYDKILIRVVRLLDKCKDWCVVDQAMINLDGQIYAINTTNENAKEKEIKQAYFNAVRQGWTPDNKNNVQEVLTGAVKSVNVAAISEVNFKLTYIEEVGEGSKMIIFYSDPVMQTEYDASMSHVRQLKYEKMLEVKRCTMKMSALLYLRGINRGKDFQLARNVQNTGEFDDILFRFLDINNVWQTLFLNVTISKVLSETYFQSLTHAMSNRDIADCFAAYTKIKRRMGRVDCQPLFNGTFENCHFAVFTNTTFNCSDGGGVNFRGMPSPVDELLDSGGENFTEEFIEAECLKWKGTSLNCSYEEDLRDFLTRCRFHTGQRNEHSFDELIEIEFKKAMIPENVLPQFLEEIRSWWEQEEVVILDRNSRILKEAHVEEMFKNIGLDDN